MDDEFFGSADQQAVARRGVDLWDLVGGDRRFQTHGRSVGVNYAECSDPSVLASLTRLQGAAACDQIPNDVANPYITRLRKMGLTTDRYEVWATNEQTLERVRHIRETHLLPDDLELASIDARTPAEDLAALADLTDRCEMMLPVGSFMRGIRARSVCLYARDRNGMPVGSSASVANSPSDSKMGAAAWWGLLTTDPARRGKGIALTVGAHAMLQMHERHGFESFFTGIRAGNVPSEKLCSKLGLAPTNRAVIVAIDPIAFSGTQMSK